MLPEELEQTHNGSAPAETDCIGSQRFRQLLQDLYTEHMTVTTALCKELSAVRGTSCSGLLRDTEEGSAVVASGLQQLKGLVRFGQASRTLSSLSQESCAVLPEAPAPIEQLQKENLKQDAFGEVTRVSTSEARKRDVNVVIVGLRSSVDANGGQARESDMYCMCSLASSPSMRWRTPTTKANFQASWNHSFVIKGCTPGEELKFVVHRQSAARHMVLGAASVSSSLFLTEDFEGSVKLHGACNASQVELLLKITRVVESMDGTESTVTDAVPRHDSGCSHYVSRHKWERIVKNLLYMSHAELQKPRDVWCRQLARNHACGAEPMKRKLTGIEEGFGMRRLQTPNRNALWSSADESLESQLHSRRRQCPCRKCAAVDPHSPKRLSWAVAGMMFILYDFVMVPMQSFDLPPNVPLDVMKWAGQVFWTFDIFVNFLTAVYVKSHLNFDLRVVARVYATTWLSFDILVTLPTYIPLFLGEHAPNDGILRGLRTMRVLRFLRLLRLAKFRHLLREALQAINSASLLLGIGMLQHLLGLILWNHVVACIWYFVGEMRGHGWTSTESFEQGSIIYRYLSALHWVLSQYQGTSEIVPVSTLERAYAVAFLQVAIIILALFLSKLTNLMRQLQDLQEDKQKIHRCVRNYLHDNNISSGLSARVNKYMEWKQRVERKRTQDESVLQLLPKSLLIDLMAEERIPVLSQHAFFALFCKEFPRICRRICNEVMSNVCPAPGETVFASGDSSAYMYWVVHGELRYYPMERPRSSMPMTFTFTQSMSWPEPERSAEVLLHSVIPDNDQETDMASIFSGSERVNEGSWLSEATLWTVWEHSGQLVGLEGCLLLGFQRVAFEEIVTSHRPAHAMASVYAKKFVGAMQRSKAPCTDLIDNEAFFQEESIVEIDRDLSFLGFQSSKGDNLSGPATVRKSIASARKSILGLPKSVSGLQKSPTGTSTPQFLRGWAKDYFGTPSEDVERGTIARAFSDIGKNWQGQSARVQNSDVSVIP